MEEDEEVDPIRGEMETVFRKEWEEAKEAEEERNSLKGTADENVSEAWDRALENHDKNREVIE